MKLHVLGAWVLIVATAAGGAPVAQATNSVGPCGTLPYPAVAPAYSHVVVVMDENLSYATFNTTVTQSPYLHGLVRACGSEALMHAATHWSQPNYMAATSGVATGSGVKTGNDNIFSQAQRAGASWKSYEESMTADCGGNVGSYQRGHNPAFWYTDLKTPVNTCGTNDVPLTPALDNAIRADSLPTFSWITPSQCGDMHWQSSCPTPSSQRISVGDMWLSHLIPRLTALPSYQQGTTLILITWDEGDGSGIQGIDCTDQAVYRAQASCQIPTIVLSPYIVPGTVDHTEQNLYTLLGTTEDILGYPRLGGATTHQGTLRAVLRF